jgi:Domain of unknown function (DUF4135)
MDEGLMHTKDPNSFGLESGLQTLIDKSVIRSGLLPQWHFIGQQSVPRDVSALGIQPPQCHSRQAVGWIALNSDGMISGKVEQPVQIPTSLPVGFGSPNRMGNFVEDFCNGFKGQLVKISEEKYRWLGDHGLLRTFWDCQRRFVPRPTWLYVWLRKQLVEPGALKSEIYQRLTLEHLARSYLVSASRPRNWPLFAL